jgi:hypothetical protein
MTVRGSTAFVATAKHCVEGVSTAVFGPARDDPSLSAGVTYASGDTGALQPIRHPLFWHPDRDDVVVAMTFTRKPAAYDVLCPSCFGRQPWGPAQAISVESVLKAGDGDPVISSGKLLQDDEGQWTLLLPAAPGTSGGPVVDTRGNLVGITSWAPVLSGAEASYRVTVVPGKSVLDLVKFAVENAHDDPPPATDPAGALPGRVLRASGDLTTFLVVEGRGRELTLVAPAPCQGIKADDRVLLRRDRESGAVTMSTPSTTCYLRDMTE